MSQVNWRGLNYAAATFLAAIAALYLSMSIDLQRPYWAMMTVFVVSQPNAAAVRSKAIQRLLGTLLGACASVAMVPRLVNSPVLLSLALAVWVGVCLSISLLDRSPRSYTMMLAGYTAAIIGFTTVNQPDQIFALAVARVEEILIGIGCATVAHSLWFPQPVGTLLRDRISDWLQEADTWLLDLLERNDPAQMSRDRTRLAGAASEIHVMATHLPYDTSNFRETAAVIQALQDKILMLIPVLSSLSDQLSALNQNHSRPGLPNQSILSQAGEWVRSGCPREGATTIKSQIKSAIHLTTGKGLGSPTAHREAETAKAHRG